MPRPQSIAVHIASIANTWMSLSHSRHLQRYLKIRYIHGALRSWYATIHNAQCNNSEDNFFELGVYIILPHVSMLPHWGRPMVVEYRTPVSLQHRHTTTHGCPNMVGYMALDVVGHHNLLTICQTSTCRLTWEGSTGSVVWLRKGKVVLVRPMNGPQSLSSTCPWTTATRTSTTGTVQIRWDLSGLSHIRMKKIPWLFPVFCLTFSKI